MKIPLPSWPGWLCDRLAHRRRHSNQSATLRSIQRMVCGSALALCAATSASHAQEAFPTHPIRIINPYPAGGAVDVITRVLAEQLKTRLGVPMVIENKPGGGSIIGTEAAVQSTPDGYTWLIAAPGNTVNAALRPGLRHDLLRDLTPIAQFAVAVNYFVVPANSPATTLDDYVRLARARPGELNYGSGGVGSSQHLGFELLKNATGIDVQPVHYKGAPAILTELASAQLSASFLPAVVTLNQVKTGRLKVLAIASDKRSRELPHVPTMAEAGYGDAVVAPWFAVMVPAKTAPAIIERVQEAIHGALTSRDLEASFTTAGAVPSYLSAAQTTEMMRKDIEKWRALGKSGGLKIE